MSSYSPVPAAPLKTPSPRGNGRNLRAHSPWTAAKEGRLRKKGRQLCREVSPEEEEDAQESQQGDTHMQDLQDQMQQLCVGKEHQGRGKETSNSGASVHFSGHQDSAPAAARGARQKLVPLRSGSGARRRDQGPSCFPAGAALQPGWAGDSLSGPGSLRSASDTGPAPSTFPDPSHWMGTAVPSLACLAHYPPATSFGSDGVLQGAPQAPHIGPSLPRSAMHPQQHSTLGLASSAEGALLGGAAAREAAASRAASSHQHLHSLSAEGPLGPKAADELQQSSKAGVSVSAADAPRPPGLTRGATDPSSRLRWCSGSNGGLGGLKNSFNQGMQGTAASSHFTSQQLVWQRQPISTTPSTASMQQHPTGKAASSSHPLLCADFDDASRIAKGTASAQEQQRASNFGGSMLPAQHASSMHSSIHSSMQHSMQQPSPTPFGAPFSAQRCHRRTSSSGSAGRFQICSSLCSFPRSSHDGDEEEGQEQEAVQGWLEAMPRDVSMQKAPPGKGRRAPTPAGNLLSRPMLEDSTEDDLLGCATQNCLDQKAGDSLTSAPSKGLAAQRRDMSAGRERSAGSSGMRSKTSSCAVALKSSGSLAARSRYAHNAAASGDCTGIGVGVGVGVAAHDGGRGGFSQRSRGATAEAFGSWGVAADDEGDDDCTNGEWGASPQRSSQHSSLPPVEDDLEHLMCDEDDFVTPPHSPAGRGGRGLPAAAEASDSTRKEGAYAAGEAALQLRRERCAGTSAAEQRSEQQAHHSASTAARHQPAPGQWFAQPQQHMCPTFPLLSGMQQQDPFLAAQPAPRIWGSAEPALPSLQQQDSAVPMHSMCMSPSFQPVEPLTGWGGGVGGSGSSLAHRSTGPRDLFDARLQEDASRDIMMEADQDDGGAGPLALDSLVCLEDFNGYMSKAAAHGDGGRAMLLWSELRARNIAPDLRTLNMLMRCLSKTAADPDHAENLMSEICACGGLKPNETTHILLTEIRLRFEQLLGM